VRAIINGAVGLHRLRNPFEGYRVRWPDNAKPSVKREALDYEKVDKVFRLGVDSGYLDDAMLGPLSLLSSRRIGILPFIRGSDFDRKHGVDIVRENGIVYDKEKGTRSACTCPCAAAHSTKLIRRKKSCNTKKRRLASVLNTGIVGLEETIYPF
jgi:hypothetical protein